MVVGRKLNQRYYGMNYFYYGIYRTLLDGSKIKPLGKGL